MASSEFYVADGWGDSLDSPSIEEMRNFLGRLDIDDPEHCEVWLTHTESGWILGCLPNNEVHFSLDNYEQFIAPRHLTKVSRAKMLSFWQKLASGKMNELEKELWLPGYTSEHPSPKPDLKDVYHKYWNELINAGRISNAQCKIEECGQTPITLTVFCPKHFFEKNLKIPCPFE